MQNSRLPKPGIMDVDPYWTAPARPEDGRCKCKAPIEPVYREPIWVYKRPLSGSGCWEMPQFCVPCQEAEDTAERARQEREQRERIQRQIAANIAAAGLSKVHERMELENLSGLRDSAREAIRGFVEGHHGLFIFGTPGTGKSHAAAGALKARMRRTMRPAAFRIVPELAISLRQAAKRHEDDEALDALSDLDALVLDDLGTERTTPYVLESLYVLIDRIWREQKSGLIITSNLELAGIADRIGDRLASRIAEICRLVKLEGIDHRLSKGRADAPR